MLRNANNMELVFLVGSATSTGCVLFVVVILYGHSCACWTIRMEKNASLLVMGSSQ